MAKVQKELTPAKLSDEIIERFINLPEDEQNKMINHLKREHPRKALALEQARDEETYFSTLGETLVVEKRKD